MLLVQVSPDVLLHNQSLLKLETYKEGHTWFILTVRLPYMYKKVYLLKAGKL